MDQQPFELDQFQKQAIQASRDNQSVIVCAPTGAGKTLIAEYVIQDCIKANRGAIYTAPIKALSNQKFRDFSLKYPGKVGILTGDVSINPDAPILIMTTEIFRNGILVEPERFSWRDWIIFDEIHYLDDIERGTVWEETLIFLPEHMKMLALSATLPNINEFSLWLKSVHKFPVTVITETTRPVPLHFFFQCNNQIFNSFGQLKDSQVLRQHSGRDPMRPEQYTQKNNRLSDLLSEINEMQGFPCIYFSFSRRRCEELAQEVASINFLSNSERQKTIQSFDRLLERFNLTHSPHINYLYPLIRNGIGYHHAGLLPTLKEIIEQLFSAGLIKMIFTTETFALGVNMPARSVVFDSLTKFYGMQHHYLKTRDFYQMAGRSGRRGKDTEGYVFSRITPWQIDLAGLEKIIYGGYEPIHSQLNSCYATVLNLYRTLGEKLFELYPKSFHYHQAKAWEQKEVLGLLNRRISLLKSLNYIENDQLTDKADLAAKVYSFELPIAELFSAGFLDKLDEESLFIVLTALVYEPRKGQERPPMNKRVKNLRRDLAGLSKFIYRQERSYNIQPFTKHFYFHLSEACQAWFHGANFNKVSSLCQVDEGEIVRYFRMSLQVIREILTAKTISPELRSRLNNCFKRINRDVVDAEHQLRQQL